MILLALIIIWLILPIGGVLCYIFEVRNKPYYEQNIDQGPW